MPALAAIGAAAMTAASTITVAGLAQAAAIVSMGTGVLSAVTGSKTLGKISMGFGIASGVGSLYSMGAGAGALSSANAVKGAGSAASAANSIEGLLNTPTKGTKAAQAQGLKTFNAKGGQTSSMDSFGKSSNSVGLNPGAGGAGAMGNISGKYDMARPGAYADGGVTGNVPGGFDPELGGKAGGFDPELEKSYFERANGTLTKYNSLINIAAGVGQGYMQGQQMEQQERLFDKRLAQDQQLIDRTAINNGTPSNFDPTLNLSRKANPFPLLQRN